MKILGIDDAHKHGKKLNMYGKELLKQVGTGMRFGIRSALLVACTCFLALFFFMLLPIIQEVGKPPAPDVDLRSVSAANLPPPPPPPPEEKPEEEEKEEEPPPPEMLEQEAPPLDLAQLELALNPSFGGEGAFGDFKLNLATMEGATTEDAEAIFSMEDLDQAPKPTVQTPPDYPRELRSKKMKGSVQIVFIVDKNGRVINPIIQKASHPAFAKPALQAVRRWRFEPGKRSGVPVQFKMRVPIAFSSR